MKYFYNGLNVLYNFDVIKATTRKSVYIINHNIIFKGSIGDLLKNIINIMKMLMLLLMRKVKLY